MGNAQRQQPATAGAEHRISRLMRETRVSRIVEQRTKVRAEQRDKTVKHGHVDIAATSVSSAADQAEQHRLNGEQDSLLRKIVQQAQRTQDLVSDLLSFARQSPGEKVLVDLSVLLHRSVQMLEAQDQSRRVRVEIFIETGFPRVRCNAKRLFQTFVEIVENAMDALAEADGGGSLRISAKRQGADAVIEFEDDGPGVREPERVFDPFYTTKPIGKGTGLGLSAVYGVIQDHGGQITCQNKPKGGALFMLRLPLETEAIVVKAAGSARA